MCFAIMSEECYNMNLMIEWKKYETQLVILREFCQFFAILLVILLIIGGCSHTNKPQMSVIRILYNHDPSDEHTTLTYEEVLSDRHNEKVDFDDTEGESGEEEAFNVLPYLQNVTQDSIVLCFETANPHYAKLINGASQDNEMILSESDNSDGFRHKILFTNLNPETRYYYSLTVDGQTIEGDFRTLPEVAGSSHNRVGFIADTQGAVGGNFDVLVDLMSNDGLDLVILPGDIVSNGGIREEYIQFLNKGHPLFKDVPFFATPGNHDYYRRGYDRNLLDHYFDLFVLPGDETYYAFTVSKTRFVVINSNHLYASRILHPNGSQMRWLRKELDSDEFKSAQFHIFVLHHSPFSNDWYGGEAKVREVILPLAIQHSIDVIIGGHFHCYERGSSNHNGHKLHYIVTGGGGARLTEDEGKRWAHLTVHEWKFHYCVMDIVDNQIDFKAVDKTGKIFDSFTIEKE